MTELEKIKYAKSFIDKLANGVNPLTDESVPDTDLINHVRISRCFFYVSDILRQVIEQGGVGNIRKKRVEKLPFQLDVAAREGFRFSETPISVSEIARRLNELIDTEQMKKVGYRHITEWLSDFGALTFIASANGKTSRRPTPSGQALGIFTEERQGQNGPYIAVFYNLDAQKFILDNLDAVIELAQAPKK